MIQSGRTGLLSENRGEIQRSLRFSREVPGPGRPKDENMIYWSTSASVKANQPFLVSYINRKAGIQAPFRSSCNGSCIDEPAIKVEEISCTIRKNGKPPFPTAERCKEDIDAKPNLVPDEFPTPENTHEEQTFETYLEEEGFKGLSCSVSQSSCIPASISSTQMAASRLSSRRLSCFTFSSKKTEDSIISHRISGKRKKPKFSEKVLSCFFPQA